MTLLDPKAPVLFGILMIALLGGYLVVFHASPAPLADPHAQVIQGTGLETCPRCHTERGLTPGCLSCHQEIDHQLKNNVGYHAFLVKQGHQDCAACHPDHLGSDFPLISALAWPGHDPNQFRHEHVTFTLAGAHDRLRCDACHGPDKAPSLTLPDFPSHVRTSTYLGLTQACLDCHEDVHAGGLASACLDCHDQQQWRPAPRFDHNQYFVLEGAHVQAKCAGCHLIPTGTETATHETDLWLFDRVRGQACTDCHQSPHRVRLAETCTACHLAADLSWSEGIRGMTAAVHAVTGFALEPAHSQVACGQCHEAGLAYAQRFPDPNDPEYERQADRCEGCHADPHAGQFQDRYRHCRDCHARDHFSPSLFGVTEHAATYPLAGKHTTVSCQACHVVDPNTGVRQFVAVARECRGCHADPHAGQFQGRYAGCQDCHNEDHFQPSSFDTVRHDKIYPLTGAHLQAQCNDCHLSPPQTDPSGQTPVGRRYRGLPTACAACHRDEHRGQFRQDGVTLCTRCHASTARWSVERFDHNRDSRFALEGAHEGLACGACHPSVPQPDGQKVIQYRPLGTRCEDCHGFKFQ